MENVIDGENEDTDCRRISTHYNRHPESDRFRSPHGALEYARSKEIIGRYLPSTPIDVLDVGGGTGAYSFWLAELGHRVAFVDLSEVHVATADSRNKEAVRKLVSIRQANVVSMPFESESFDLVLNMGPMYHLSRPQRARALKEIARILRKDGVLISAYISRFAAIMDGYKKEWISNPEYNALSVGDLQLGVHQSPDDDKYFTLAYLYRPEEVGPELETCGFQLEALFAVEGFFWTYPHLSEFVDDKDKFAHLLEHARMLEKEPSLMGSSAHFISVAAKTAKSDSGRNTESV